MTKGPESEVHEETGSTESVPTTKKVEQNGHENGAAEEDASPGEPEDIVDWVMARRHLPLERQKANLQTKLIDLKNSLVSLINLKYLDFIGLSTELSRIEDKVQVLQVSVNGLRHSLLVSSNNNKTIPSYTLTDCL